MDKKVLVIPQGGVPIEIDGTQRVLRYSINRLLQIEERLGVDMLNSGMELFSQKHLGNLKTLRFLLWVGIGGNQEGIEEEAVGEWFDPQNMPLLSVAVANALGASFDDPAASSATKEGAEEAEKN